MTLRKKVKCFYHDLSKYLTYSQIYRGLQAIEVETIIGTVDKCGELDMQFNYVNGRKREWAENVRRYRISEATLNFHCFPPITVNRLKGRYYVVDGHRRVAAAKKNGVEFIDAEVTEFIQHHDSVGNGEMGNLGLRKKKTVSVHSIG